MNKIQEAERIILGSCFHDEKYVPGDVYDLEVSDFTQETTRRIFETIKNIHHEKESVNLTTVSNKSGIESNTIIDEYINYYKDGMDVAYCIAAVKHNSEKKRTEETLVRLSIALRKEELSLEEVKADLRAIISPKLSGKITIEDVYNSARMLKAYKDHVKNLKRNSFTTGFDEIDKKKVAKWWKRKAEVLWETQEPLPLSFFESPDFEVTWLKKSEDFFLASRVYL